MDPALEKERRRRGMALVLEVLGCAGAVVLYADLLFVRGWPSSLSVVGVGLLALWHVFERNYRD